MFMGEYQHNIDAKGRIIIPAKFRQDLGDKFVVTRGMDGCLFGYPMAEWEKIQDKIDNLPVNKKDARYFTRFFFSAAVECEFDKQGRINIPNVLRKYAQIEKKCVVVGVQIALKFGVMTAGTISVTMLKRTLMKLRKI